MTCKSDLMLNTNYFIVYDLSFSCFFFFFFQGLLVATIFCFFNGEVRWHYAPFFRPACTHTHTHADFLFVIRDGGGNFLCMTL